jgi:hypothetical protein
MVSRGFSTGICGETEGCCMLVSTGARLAMPEPVRRDIDRGQG